MGTEQQLVQQVPLAAKFLVDGFGKRNLHLLPKSGLIASTPTLASNLQLALQQAGLQLKVLDEGKDLGGDFSCGAKGRVTVQKIRLQKAMDGARQVKVLKAHTKQARKLVFTGIMPRIYGLSVMGPCHRLSRKAGQR